MFIASGSCLVKKSYQQAIIAQNEKRKAHARKLYDIYTDEQLQFVEELIQKLYSGKRAAHEITPISLNIVQKIINRVSGVYTKDATRLIDGTDREQLAFNDFEKNSFLGVRMKQSNRLCNLLGNVLLRLVYRDGQCDIDILTPDLYQVECGISQRDLEAITIDKYIDDEIHTKQYTRWTKDSIQTLNHNFHVISEKENIYKILPFISIFSELPVEGYWQNGANSLLSVQETINMQLSDLFHILRLQGFGVPVVVGATGKNNSSIDLGANSMLQLPENGKFYYEAPKAPIQSVLDSIDFLMKNCAVANGLPADSVSIHTNDESGLSKLVSSQELIEKIEDQKTLFLQYEQQVFNVWKILYNTHEANNISDTCTLKTNFNEIKPATSKLDELNEQKQLLELGLISPIDILMGRDPDLSREDAQAKLLEIKDDIQEFNKITSY